MNGHDLYKLLLKASNTFGLAFYEIGLIKVSFGEGFVLFTYEKQEMKVNV
jgi:hypothetical protein